MAADDWAKRKLKFDSAKQGTVSNTRNDDSSMKQEQTGVKSFNATLENFKTEVCNLLDEKRNGIPVFYHIRICKVGEIVNHVLTLKSAMFYQKMQNLKKEKSAVQSDLHKEIIRFLNLKSVNDGGGELKNEKDVDNYGDEFVTTYNDA